VYSYETLRRRWRTENRLGKLIGRRFYRRVPACAYLASLGLKTTATGAMTGPIFHCLAL